MSMKLLLTSAGVTNWSVANSLVDMVGKPAKDIKIGFIPTAANVEEGNKDWYIEQLTNLYKFGFEWIDIVDTADPIVDWQSRLSTVDVIMVSGGNTFYLLDHFRTIKFGAWLKTSGKVYMGISAGSIVMGPSIGAASIPPADSNITGITDLNGLCFVDFEIECHCDEARFVVVERYAVSRNTAVYALDDNSAIKVVDDGTVDVISEGNWKLFS